MSLTKFLDLLARRSLFLGQLSALRSADPYEGSLGADRLIYLRRIMSDDNFARQELHIPAGEEIPPPLRASYDPSLTAWQNERSAERMYINCWHINEVESANLWAVYTNQGEGVAIQSSVGSLSSSLREFTGDFTIAPVRYINHNTFKMGPSFENAAFYKRLSFKSEKELRLRVLLPIEKCTEQIDGKSVWTPPRGMYMQADCEILIERVYVSPTLGDWFAETVQKVIESMGLNSPVIKSSINESRIL
ncbi:hypothetical protein [Devosia sp.]|uniref:hypothetical protein n=1 Tax=Devosia sp. TaxID=1871048 RepID=UPI0032642511